MLDFIADNETLIAFIAVFSLFTFFATLLIVPWIIPRLPEDYFNHPNREQWLDSQSPVIRLTMLILKNLLGAIILILGIFMLILPGQGLLTIVIGLILLNFPGKYRLQCWLIQRGPVLRSANWLRRRGGKPPLVFQHSDDQQIED